MEVIKPAMDLLYFTAGAWAVGGGIMWFTKSKEKLGTSKIDKGIKNMQGKVGYTVAKGITIKPKKTLEHILFVGASGEAKTAAGVLNNMLRNNLPACSKIIVDLKGEIYDLTHKYRESLGEKCYIFEPLGTQACFNPLDFAEDFSDVRDIGMNMLMNTLKNDYDKWCDMALPLMTASLLWAKTLPKDYANIPRAVELLTKNNLADIVDELRTPNDELINQQLTTFLSCVDSDPTRASIMVTLLTKLNAFTDPKIVRTLSKSDFTPDDLRSRVVNIYVKYDLSKVNVLRPILALFNGTMMDKLMDNYDKNKRQNAVLFILDEMQNNGRIPKLPDAITMFRSYKIGVVGLVQNFAKIYELYGRYDGMTLISGFKTKCVLPGLSDIEALQYLCNPLISGNTQITITQGKNINKVKKATFDGDELRRLDDGKIAIIAGNNYVVKADQDRWYKNKECKKNGGIL